MEEGLVLTFCQQMADSVNHPRQSIKQSLHCRTSTNITQSTLQYNMATRSDLTNSRLYCTVPLDRLWVSVAADKLILFLFRSALTKLKLLANDWQWQKWTDFVLIFSCCSMPACHCLYLKYYIHI